LVRDGLCLVPNRICYKVTWTPLDGGRSQRLILCCCYNICRDGGGGWTDTLPISSCAPFSYTLDTAGSTAKSRFLSLCQALKWNDPALDSLVSLLDAGTSPAVPVSADSMLAQMAADSRFKVEQAALSDEDRRALIGVLYELALRSKEVALVQYAFAQDVDIDFISRVKEAGLVGVQISASTVRQYHTAAAAHVLGRVAQMDKSEWEYYRQLGYSMNETVGKDGVEKAFEEYLRGEKGIRDIETNTAGKVVSETYRVLPQPGENIVLTLDIRLQEAVEQSLAARVPALETAEGAAVAVVSVKNGDVLALASYPTFDLSKYSAQYSETASNPLNPFYNRATQANTRPLNLQNGHRRGRPGGRHYRARNQDPGYRKIYPITKITNHVLDLPPVRAYPRLQNVSQAITNSCNVFFYDVGRRLGIAKLSDYARLFGLGEATGIELPERLGVVAGPNIPNPSASSGMRATTLPAAIGPENNRFNPPPALPTMWPRWSTAEATGRTPAQGSEVERLFPGCLRAGEKAA
jgi:penicillin-binding protein 2